MVLHVFVPMIDVLISTLAIRVVWGAEVPPAPNLCLEKTVYMNTLKADGGIPLGHTPLAPMKNTVWHSGVMILHKP